MKRIINFFLLIFISSQTKTNVTINQTDALQPTQEQSAIFKQTACDLQQWSRGVARAETKSYLIAIYMSADNDLELFSRRNLDQLKKVGSTPYAHVVVHLDTRTPTGQKITKVYHVQRDKLVIVANYAGMDSGDPATLINFITNAAQSFPAQHVAIILWNHGTGIIDIGRPRSINPSTLFSFNSLFNVMELDRSMPFLEFAQHQADHASRGVCFDDTTGNYLTNQKLEMALKSICQTLGKKIKIIGFDACLMAMLEVGNIVRKYADIMVGSQEVEMGTGWNYQLALAPLLTNNLTPEELASHLVDAYNAEYLRITPDYTQSAIDLQFLTQLEEGVNELSLLLLEALKRQKSNSAKDAIKASRHRLLCTHFDEPSYIDLQHFCSNLAGNLNKISLQTTNDSEQMRMALKKAIQKCLNLIEQCVINNATGKNLNKAGGISIYSPERSIHSSYLRTPFAGQNNWIKLLAALT